METLRLIGGLSLPWMLGIALLVVVRERGRRIADQGELAWIVGAGYLVGAFALTVWMRALSVGGIRFGVAPIALPLLALTAILGWIAWKREGLPSAVARDAVRALVQSPGLSGIARIGWMVTVAWLALRFLLLGLEVSWQPLYPWDAWIQWATKARVWYELGYLAPFARAAEWFQANGAVFFDASPEYPPTMPLLQTWTCIALGRWDDALMNWPWWQISVALTLAVYGGLRRVDTSPVTALVAAFLVASLPLANVHVALAGYADLPLAAFYAVGVLAFLRWSIERRWSHALGALLLLVACTQIKNPGIAWAMTVAPAALVAILPRHGMKIAGLALAAAIFLLAVLAQTNTTVFNYHLHLDYDPEWTALGDSYFLLGNWHLLWYGAVGAAVLARRQLFAPPLAALTVIVGAGVLFLFIVFGFTTARAWVVEQTTVNRATLHFAPVAVIFMVLAFQAFANRWRASVPSTTSSEMPAAPALASLPSGQRTVSQNDAFR